MKQRITLPDKVTSTIFDLPCIQGVHKMEGGGIYYELTGMMYARPGNIIEQGDDGKWRLIRKEEG